MADNISLIKANPLLPAEDYTAMRKQGFKEIEKLGHENWTDYNNSDPGITILEAVLYAITDLSYRTGFEIKDLLAPEKIGDDTWKQIFYTARQILHNSPLTITDYRKLIIDVRGVRNAWIEPSKEYEVPLWADYNYYEKRKDTDCSCEDGEMETCFGKLSLDPASPKDLDAFKKERTEKIKAAQDKVGKAISDTEKKIEVINKELSELGDSDPLAVLGLEKKRIELEKYKKRKIKQQDELVKELGMVDAMKFIASKIVELEGLYNVMVEYEENVPEEERDDVRQQVVQRLSAHRNLCEDFLSVNTVEEVELNLAASIALEEYADPDVVLANVFFIIYKYFTPSIPFHTIQQMQEKGYTIDEIFEGPALHHGFIEDSAIEATDLYRDIRLSDIINEMTDIKGVKAITYLHLPFSENGNSTESRQYFAKWLKRLKEERKIARINPSTSQVIFCKEHDIITYNVEGSKANRRPERMLKFFTDLKTAERRYKLEGIPLDLPVPVGENMDLADYYPVTYSLPMCYGVSDRAGLPADANEIRKAQALQLRGYLLFFEQLLSDHLVQLSHLRDLFTMDESPKHTIYSNYVQELFKDHKEGKEIIDLLIDHGKDDSANPATILRDFTALLEKLTESENQFNYRRNRFLTHFLARFSEDMSEYDAITRWLVPKKVDERLIQDKINILKDGEYYKISSNRGKGYDYSKSEFWDVRNVSGTERRVGRLLGFHDVNRRTLAPSFIISEPIMELDNKKQSVQKRNKKGDPLSRIRFMDPKNGEQVLLTSVDVIEGCCTEALMGDIIANADQRRHFKFFDEINPRARKTAGQIGHFWFELWDGADPKTAVHLATSERYEKKEDRDKAWRALQNAVAAINNNEGMHLVEHLLLRPKFDEVLDEANTEIKADLLNICLNTCDLGVGIDTATEIPQYKKRLRRIPADKCYDRMPWILEYFKFNEKKKDYTDSILFAETFPDEKDPVPLKFRYYKDAAQRAKDLQEFGSERKYYRLLSVDPEEGGRLKWAFAIYNNEGELLAQSPYVFFKRTAKEIADNKAIDNDIEVEIAGLMLWFGYEMDWYCEADPCDNSEDPYSFRATIVLPCWPKRLRDATFQNLVAKTINAQSPTHVHINIIWLGITEMQRFEKAYYDWLDEMSKTEMPVYDKVNPLVQVLNTLRPCGVCEDDCKPAKEDTGGVINVESAVK